MAVYQDKTGKTWTLTMDTNALKRIRKNVRDRNGNPVDLLYIGNGETIRNFLSDPILLTDILWAILEQQAKADQISWNAFQAAHSGNVFIDARAAMAEALGEYFPTLEGLAFRDTVLRILQERETALEMVRKNLKENQKITPTVTPENPSKEERSESGN